MPESQPKSVGASPPQGQWQFRTEDGPAETAATPPQDVAPVTWTASEFIAHQKSTSWYVLLVVVTIVFGGFIFWLTRDYLTVGLIAVAAVLFGVIASRKPRELQYQVDATGIRIGEKLYSYNNFKSFAVVQEEGIQSIWFMPLKRFMPSLSIYFAPDDGEKIAEALSQFLPVENRQLDPLDRLMHKLHF